MGPSNLVTNFVTLCDVWSQFFLRLCESFVHSQRLPLCTDLYSHRSVSLPATSFISQAIPTTSTTPLHSNEPAAIRHSILDLRRPSKLLRSTRVDLQLVNPRPTSAFVMRPRLCIGQMLDIDSASVRLTTLCQVRLFLSSNLFHY